MFGSDYNLWAILLATVANQAIGRSGIRLCCSPPRG